jgi:hypothetical protein
MGAEELDELMAGNGVLQIAECATIVAAFLLAGIIGKVHAMQMAHANAEQDFQDSIEVDVLDV